MFGLKRPITEDDREQVGFKRFCLQSPAAQSNSGSSTPGLEPNLSDVGASPLSTTGRSPFQPIEDDNDGWNAMKNVHLGSSTPEHSTPVPLDSMDWVPTQPDSEATTYPGGAEKHVCYGAIICEAKINLQQLDWQSRILNQNSAYHMLDVISSGQCVGFADSAKPLCYLTRQACQALQRLGGCPNVSTKAVIEAGTLKRSLTGSKSGGIVAVSINVYGPPADAPQTGAILSKASTFLQHPFFLEPHYQYFNPQLYRSGSEMEDLTHLVGLTESEIRAKVLSDEIEHVLESLDTVELDQGSSDSSVSLTPADAISTELMSHQSQALRFMQQRESHGWYQAAQKDLRNITEVIPADDIPCFSTGGILADAMGLGKTLTILSAIVSTANHAKRFSTGRDASAGAGDLQLRTRATLVVVTSMQVLNVWEMEISKHARPGKLKWRMFHGAGRPQSPEQIMDYDMVITTYGTLYRVVLDEAHWIRNQGTNQFLAALNLPSLHRWCVTGTPIQNRLEDLLSLLKFLQFQPFARSSVFQRHILEPLRADTPDRTVRLKALLRTICLRRSESLLKLPEPRVKRTTVVLCSEERAIYNEILKKCAIDMDEAISSQVRIKRYSVLFTTIMKLRRLCNHGTFGNTMANGDVASIADSRQDTEHDCEICGVSSENSLELAEMGNFCPQCGESLSPILRRSNVETFENNEGVPAPPPAPLIKLWPPQPAPVHRIRLSSKLQSVVDNLERLSNGPKSLVFSYWTTTLDMLERHFKLHNMPCLRIDGTVAYKERLRILEYFKSSDIPILLMSIQTGAVGLNLTVANYVHVIEPQWNPSVEEQAIARAVRMGQTRTVTIFRYVVVDSVEEHITRIQRKKRNLAKFTLDGGSGDGITGSLEELKFVAGVN